jgi:hypothetical protein
MNRLYRPALLLLLLCAALSPSPASSGAAPPASHGGAPEVAPPAEKCLPVPPIRMAVVSYWEPDSLNWNLVPDNSLVVINPVSGILKGDTYDALKGDELKKWVDRAKGLKERGMTVLAYVPTGAFSHTNCKPKEGECQPVDRIRLQVNTYYNEFKTKDAKSKAEKLLVDGIFYDEASPNDGAPQDYNKEYELLRSLNKPPQSPNTPRMTAFNVGWYSEKAVEATHKGEHLVLYESTPYDYHESAAEIKAETQKAWCKGVVVWHLLHSVCDTKDMCRYVKMMAERGASYGYVTNIGGEWKKGDQTWNILPKFWDDELKVFLTPNKTCDELFKD